MQTDYPPVMEPGLVSVIIPAYNHEHYVAEAIESVLNQTYAPVQLIVVNDGSTDNTGAVIESMAAHCAERTARFTYLEQENRGVVDSLRLALRFADGEFVSVLASDDRFHANKLETLVNALRDAPPEVGVIFGDARFIDAAGTASVLVGRDGPCETFLDYYLSWRDLGVCELGSYCSLLAGNYLPAMSALIKAETLRRSGGFQEGKLLEDWPLWIRLARISRVLVLDRVVADYRRHGRNLTLVAAPELAQETMTMLLAERGYCTREPQLRAEWMRAFVACLLGLVRHRRWLQVRSSILEVPMREWLPGLTAETLRRILRRVTKGLRMNVRSPWHSGHRHRGAQRLAATACRTKRHD